MSAELYPSSVRESRARASFLKVLCCVALVVVCGCGPENATGIYLAKFTNGLARLELVQSDDHTVTGEIDWVSYDADGELITRSAGATGAVDNGTVNLTFKGNEFLSGTSTGAGELNWAALTLTGDFNGGRVSTVTFTKSSEVEYQSALATVKKNALSIAVARGMAEQQRQESAKRAKLVSEIEKLTAALEKFGDEAVVHLQRWPSSEKALQAITSDMEVKLQQERSLTGESNSFARGRLVFAINQDDFSAEQMHYGLQSLASTFSTNVVPMMAEAENAKTICASDSRPDVASACESFSQVYRVVQSQYRAVGTGLDHLESIYQEQHQKNQDIIQAAAASN